MALITVPSSFKVTNSSFRLINSVSQNESPFSLRQQTYDWGGSRWEGEVTIRPYTYDETADLRAFLARLKGRANTFLYGDPDYLVKGPRGSLAGTPLVNGASQTGNTIIIDGFTAGQSNVVRAGDYMQLGSGASSELYMVLADADSSGAGSATLLLNRTLISPPSDNETPVFTNARGVFRLVDNQVEWSSNESSVTQITLAFKEAV